MNALRAELLALWASVVESESAAECVAYRNRHSMRWVRMDRPTHDRLAEALQTWRESERLCDLGPPIPSRAPDGTAPPLSTILGCEVTIDDAVGGMLWDVGVPSVWDTLANWSIWDTVNGAGREL